MNPATVRVSETLMLSDCVGCDSVFRFGYPNPVHWGKRSPEFAQIKKLGELCDQLHDEHGPYSVAYGYISPDLSRKIVKYQDPNKPSYHRFDHGAALDLCFHLWEDAPIKLAHQIDEYHDYSRLITYSESPWICLATRTEEDSPRKALYENRYEGVRKPKFVKYSDNKARRSEQKRLHELEHGWEGAGYPTYHGGGREQLHHVRTGKYSFRSDFLYHAQSVAQGGKNLPPRSGSEEYIEYAEHEAKTAFVLDIVCHDIGSRVSVVHAYDRGKWPYTEFIPCAWDDAEDIAHLIIESGYKAEVRNTASGIKRVRFYV